MLAVPAVLLTACVLLALYSMARDPSEAATFSGPAWLGVVLLPVPLVLVVMVEHRAIRRREPRAAAWIAGIGLGFPIVGSLGWIEGLLRVTGVLPRGHEWHSWAEFAVYSAFLAYMGFIGFGHLQWWRLLRAAKPAATFDEWD